MAKLGITKKMLLKEYNHAINEIAEDDENRTTFTGDEICQIVFGVIIKKKVKTELTCDKLYTLYKAEVKALKISKKDWVKNYGVKDIISIIYTILIENK